MIVKQKILLLIILLGASSVSFAQKEVRKQLRSGNRQYNKEHYTESEIAYRKALEANSRSVESAYNLGNSLYKQGKFQEAMEQYQVVLNSNKEKAMQARTWHNMGNIMMNAKDYAKSIDAYKNALINNPHDNETRYNLAVAQKLLQDQPQQDQNQDQDKDQENQDQNQQNQDQQNQQDKQDQQDNQNQQKEDQQQQNNSSMDRQKAEQILEALSQDEKSTQDKVKKEEAQKVVGRNKPDKDW